MEFNTITFFKTNMKIMNLLRKTFLILFVISLIGCNSTNEIELSQDEIEEVIANLEKVDNKVTSLFMETNSPTEMEAYLDDIKAMEEVEDAWLEPSVFCVKIKNGGKVAWKYIPTEPENDITELKTCLDDLKNMVEKHELTPSRKGEDSNLAVCKNKKVCIINQQFNDKSRDSYKLLYLEVGNLFERFEFEDVRFVNVEEFTLDFIKDELTNYGVIFMVTHGAYLDGKHWLLTGERINMLIPSFDIDRLYNWLNDEVMMVTIKEQASNKLWYNVTYYAINEDFVDNQVKGSFSENSILFNTACQSLMGNYNLWNSFKRKKMGCYLGYTEENSVGKFAGTVFFETMMYSGNTTGGTYKYMADNLRYETGVKKNGEKYMAELICLPENSNISFFEEEEFDNVEMVDLGLSVKWASCNWGAASMTEFGETFRNWHLASLGNRWGVHKKDPEFKYKDGCYSWHEEDGGCTKCLLTEGITYTKYDYIYKQNKKMRMPKVEDFEELLNNCDLKSVIIDDVPGIQFISKINGKSIFLPAHTNDYSEQPGFGKETIKVYVTEGSYLTATFDKRYTDNDEFIEFVAVNSLLSFNFMGQASNMSVMNNITVKLFNTSSYIFEKDENGEPLFDVNDIPIYYYYIRPVCD